MRAQPPIGEDRLLIIDFGGQYTQLIARVIRELGVYSEIFPYDVDYQRIVDFNARGVILSGGPDSVGDQDTARIDDRVFDLGIPILGICYGMQTMAHQLGGGVSSSTEREFGYARVSVVDDSPLLESLDDHPDDTRDTRSGGRRSLDVWMSHGDRVTELPPGFVAIGESAHSPLAAIANEDRHFYGVQFHPEVTHTPKGRQILAHFAHAICGCRQDWTPVNIVDSLIASAKERTGTDHVILGLSGGVDSSVVAALLHRAIGDRLTCIFVDNGLLRLDEASQVMATFSEHLGVRVVHVDASKRFLDALLGVTDPEAKRKVIGEMFIRVFEEQAALIKNARWLAQGTIYPDVIESAGNKNGKAHVIKSHHNVGGLPDDMQFKLLEPLRDLFKDEVRRVGVELGLAHEMVFRHPFPGPGLGVRILGEVTQPNADLLRQADAIFIEELRAADWYDKVSQAFAVFLPVKSVGVVGDGRAYEYVIALRSVETVDFMTARWSRLPYELLDRVSSRIINEVSGISRVTYDISGKPPATIEWE